MYREYGDPEDGPLASGRESDGPGTASVELASFGVPTGVADVRGYTLAPMWHNVEQLGELEERKKVEASSRTQVGLGIGGWCMLSGGHWAHAHAYCRLAVCLFRVAP